MTIGDIWPDFVKLVRQNIGIAYSGTREYFDLLAHQQAIKELESKVVKDLVQLEKLYGKCQWCKGSIALNVSLLLVNFAEHFVNKTHAPDHQFSCPHCNKAHVLADVHYDSHSLVSYL